MGLLQCVFLLLAGATDVSSGHHWQRMEDLKTPEERLGPLAHL